MPLPDTPLDSEERALAARLAELHAQAEPSPALDARVLNAARQSLAPKRRRWPAALGLAASLLLAVGLAWRLRPLPPARPMPAADMHAARAMRMAVESPVVAPLRDEQPSVDALPREVAAKTAARAPSPAVADAPVAAPPPESVPRASFADSPMALPAPPAAPPGDAGLEAPVPDVGAPPAPEQSVDQNAASQADNSVDAARGDEPEDEVPPATADSPTVRDAWLLRIHGLIDSGDVPGARTSLRAFAQRYPDYVLPEDLRALAR